MHAWRAGALLSIAFAIAAGCSVVTSYDGYVADGPAAKRFPSRPPSATGKSTPDLYGAMSKLEFFAEQQLGYDLDNLCTTDDLTSRPCTNAKAANQADPERCIDNSAGLILGGLYPDSANARLLDSIRHGRNGLLLRVSGWDGTPNDSSVQVALFNVVGLEGDEEGGSPATFKGADRFIVERESIDNEEEVIPKFTSPSAYVADGVLVAPLDLFRFRIEVPNAQGTAVVVAIPLYVATLVGKVQREGATGLRMTRAQLVGRLPVAEVFKQISGIGICRNSPNFAGTRERACAALDITLDPGARRNVACDALSFAMQFDIGPAQRGGIASSPGVPSVCGDEPIETCK